MEELQRITISQKPDSNVRHHHMVDLKSSKVVVTIVSLSALSLASLFGNIRLLDVKSRMSDNDMKYRYIQSTNGINKEGLNKLKDVFHYQRDKKKKSGRYMIKLELMKERLGRLPKKSRNKQKSKRQMFEMNLDHFVSNSNILYFER